MAKTKKKKRDSRPGSTPARAAVTSRKSAAGRTQLEEKDFTAGGIHALGTYEGSTGDPEFDARIKQLVRDWDPTCTPSLIQEMIITAMRVGKDRAGDGELKLLNRALKEMRTANNVFRPYKHVRKVSIFGSARTLPDKLEFQGAVEFGKRIAKHGFMGITGAGDGIMGAAQLGVGREGSFGLNIRLPFEQEANPTILGDAKLVEFNYFFTRKLSFMKESHAFALFPGGFGTMDEGFELLTLMQTGKCSILPVVMVDAPGGSYWKTFLQFIKEHLLRLGMISEDDLFLFRVTDDIDEAVAEILQFYKHFHSYRHVGRQVVIRLNKRLDEAAVASLNETFRELWADGGLAPGDPLPAERNEEEILHLPRLICTPHLGNYGRFRLLIDAINKAPTAADEMAS